MPNDCKQPLIPSVLYTEARKKVKQEVEEELKVPDPDSHAAQAAIDDAIVDDKSVDAKQ